MHICFHTKGGHGGSGWHGSHPASPWDERMYKPPEASRETLRKLSRTKAAIKCLQVTCRGGEKERRKMYFFVFMDCQVKQLGSHMQSEREHRMDQWFLFVRLVMKQWSGNQTNIAVWSVCMFSELLPQYVSNFRSVYSEIRTLINASMRTKLRKLKICPRHDENTLYVVISDMAFH